MKSHLVQCLACHKVKNSEGLWVEADADSRVHNISHTYCSECYAVLQNNLFAAKEFKSWSFEKQVHFLAKDLDTRRQKYDRRRFKLYLEDFFYVSESDFEKFYQVLKGRLYQSVCLVCNNEIAPGEKKKHFGQHPLHYRCHKEMRKKLSILIENNWDKTDKLDAYFDLLRLEKMLRPAVREFLTKVRKKATTCSSIVV